MSPDCGKVLRVGYAFGQCHLIEALRRFKNSFNSYPVGRIAEAGAIASIKDVSYFHYSCAEVIRLRKWLSDRLNELGFEMTDSYGNFIFMTHPKVAAYDLTKQLRQLGIIVRHFNNPRIYNYVRVSIGTINECELLLSSCYKIIFKVSRTIK